MMMMMSSSTTTHSVIIIRMIRSIIPSMNNRRTDRNGSQLRHGRSGKVCGGSTKMIQFVRELYRPFPSWDGITTTCSTCSSSSTCSSTTTTTNPPPTTINLLLVL